MILDIAGLSSVLIVFKNIINEKDYIIILGHQIDNKFILVGISLILILRIGFSYLINIKIYDFGYRIRTLYKCELLKLISNQSIVSFNKKKVSDYLFYINDITQNATTYFLIPFIKNSSEILSFLLLITIIIYKTTILSVALPLLILLILLVLKILNIKVEKRIGSEQNKPWSESIKTITNAVTNFKYIKITKTIDLLNNYIIELNNRYCVGKLREHKSTLLNKVYLESIIILLIISLSFLLLLGNQTITENKELFVMYFFLIIRFGPIIGNILRNFTLISISYDSVIKLLDFEKSLESCNYIKQNKTHKTQSYDIIFKNINYKYSENYVFNKNISFNVKKGDWIVVRGASGSGKTTLTNIALNLLEPHNGEITYSNEFRQDLDSGDIGYLSQSPIIATSNLYEVFRKSIDDKIDEQKILKINKLINYTVLGEKLNEISSNDYYIGENGSSLSGGQLQRLALARALYVAKRYLILDEPSSALDNTTSEKIFCNIKNNFPHLTVIIITHDRKIEDYGDQILSL